MEGAKELNMLKKFLQASALVLMLHVLVSAPLNGEGSMGVGLENSCHSEGSAFGCFARNNFAFLVWNGVFFAAILGAAAFGKRK